MVAALYVPGRLWSTWRLLTLTDLLLLGVNGFQRQLWRQAPFSQHCLPSRTICRSPRHPWPIKHLQADESLPFREETRLYESSTSYSELDDVYLEQGDDEDDSPAMGAWVPVGSISCLRGLTPTEIEIMGRKLVVWEANRQWSVLVDECPHRMAPLSVGRIDSKSNCIECSYHGWQFDRNGTLQSIPQLEYNANLRAESRSVQSFPVHVTGDLLWVFLPTSFHGESFPRSLLPEQYYVGLSGFAKPGVTFFAQEMPFSFDFFVENVLDGPSHAYFAHHAWGFDRAEAEPLPCKIAISNFTELATEVTYTRMGVKRRRRYGFQRPFLLTNKQPGPGDTWKTAILFLGVPVREGYSRLITTFDSLSPHPLTPDWLLHIINGKFLEGDLMIHNTEITIRERQAAVPKYIHATSSDTPCKAWRSWWTNYGMSAAPPHTFGPASYHHLRLLDRKDLTDPWRLHTSKCSKCRAALKNAKVVQQVGWALVWGALAVFRRKSVAVLFALLGAGISLVAARVIRELQGPMSRSEVGERSSSATL